MRALGCVVAAMMALAACGSIAFAEPLPQPQSGTVLTCDGVAIAYDRYAGGYPDVVVIVPGFYNSKENRWMRQAAEMVAAGHDVIVFNMRGHGSSGGVFTWSAREDRDVDAVLDLARSLGYRHIGILAFSLGAASSVNAVSRRDDVDSMVLISCPSRFDMIDFRFWQPGMLADLTDNIACGWQGKGARCGNFFLGKERPVDSIRRITRAAILIIHGDRDWVIADRHARKLFAAAASAKEKDLVIIPGGLHAEQLIEHEPERMKELIVGWFARTLPKE